jgi:tRNA(Arg) A34 adenosine deaminase TadA
MENRNRMQKNHNFVEHTDNHINSSRGKRPGEMVTCDGVFIDRLLTVIEEEIIPLTDEGVKKGNKVFGAAILNKSDLSTIIVGTNHETINPLWHGEIYTINQYYEMVNQDESKRVEPNETIFFSTHEPCTMCASAIAWGGYDNVYYLFSHEDSRDSFNIGHDLKILKEVFKHDPGEYARQNDYWTAYWVVDLINNCDPQNRPNLLERLSLIKKKYDMMSKTYQNGKNETKNIPLK